MAFYGIYVRFTRFLVHVNHHQVNSEGFIFFELLTADNLDCINCYFVFNGLNENVMTACFCASG